uniref:Protein kinase domain-containing protein n=1 Tax=Kalanchoe fedtschenkoi TaxID=63787 RepID=A0A7N1A3B2_KALFE
MGYFSCNADSAIPICHSITHKKTTKQPNKHSSNKVRHQDQEITQFSYSELQIATNNFSMEMFLGKGSHGRVYRAALHGGKLIAAVKKTKGYKRDRCATSPAENEIEILSKVRNPGLVNLIGFCVDSAGEKLIVVEYMSNGTLYDLLHTSNKPLGWRKRIQLALEVARAVHSLHSANPPVIHRDIKSSNVLLDRNMSARLGDFGLALRGHVEDVRIKCTPPAGTLGYLDPSYLAPGDLSTKSDVFSFGILVLEIVSGRNAIDVDYSPPSIIDWAIPLIRICDFSAICDRRIGSPADTSIAQQLALLASRCVAVEAERRPEMGEVAKCLKELRKRVGASSSWSKFTMCVRKPEGSGPGRQLVVSDIDNNHGVQETVVKDLKAGLRGNRIRVSSLELLSNGTRPRGEGMSRSRSIGSVDEIRQVTDGKKLESSVKTRVVRLNKSRSVGLLHGRSLVRFSREREDAVRDQTGEETESLIGTHGQGMIKKYVTAS